MLRSKKVGATYFRNLDLVVIRKLPTEVLVSSLRIKEIQHSESFFKVPPLINEIVDKIEFLKHNLSSNVFV